MIVKLKKNHRYRDLTFGQPYVVIGIEGDDLRILNDAGRPFLCPPDLFSLDDPSEPVDWITEGRRRWRAIFLSTITQQVRLL